MPLDRPSFEPTTPFTNGLVVDLRKPDPAALRELAESEVVQLLHLSPARARDLTAAGLPRLRSLSLRHLQSTDLALLHDFPQLTHLQVWQSAKVTSLDGLQSQRGLRWLGLSELGLLQTLEPVASLQALTELHLNGGMWRDQQLAGDYAPLASLRSLRRLSISSVRGPRDLSPILDLPDLEDLFLSTDSFPLEEIARVAARYEFWRREHPWLREAGASCDCPACGSTRVLLFLRRTKRLRCPKCDGAQLERDLRRFENLIDDCARHLAEPRGTT